jgi:drug/metabolite transporter (DMT)-like permease
MTAGIILILAGILLVVFPPLLSIIVAALLIFAGATLISIARFERRQSRHFNNPTIEFFIRH